MEGLSEKDRERVKGKAVETRGGEKGIGLRVCGVGGGSKVSSAFSSLSALAKKHISFFFF